MTAALLLLGIALVLVEIKENRRESGIGRKKMRGENNVAETLQGIG